MRISKPPAALLRQAAPVDDGTQQFSLKFRAPPAGAYQLQVMCVSDYWIGCDAKLPLKLKARA